MVQGYAVGVHAAVAACVAVADYVVVVKNVAVIVVVADCVAVAAYAAVVDCYEVVDSHAVVGDYCAVWHRGLFPSLVVAEDLPADDPLPVCCYVVVLRDSLPDGPWQLWLADHDSQKHIEPGSHWPGLND